MEQYLVTGGAGFIGSHIVHTLVQRAKKVRVLDNLLTGNRENLADIANEIEFLKGDVRDPIICQEAVRGVDCVLHQAALPSVPRSIKDPLTTNEINTTGTLNMLIAARDAGVRKFVFASSSSVYGDDSRLPKKEENAGKPLSPYAVTKLVGEHYCRLFSDLYGMGTVSLRYFNVFGPRQDPNSPYAAVIPLFMKKILRGESPTVFGNGEQSRDFTYVENVVAANILAAEAAISANVTMNIATGDKMTINSILRQINQLAGTDIAGKYVAERPGDILHSFADISRAKEVLGYTPHISQVEGLKRTFAWYKTQ